MKNNRSQKILNVYKPQGMTPHEIVLRIKKQFPEYKELPTGYAGRLDPLAHGVLLLMTGEETTKKRENYLNLPKEYEFEAIFGMATDTYDALGLVSHKVKSHQVIKLDDFQLEDLMTQFIQSKLGKQTQSYPPFSSKTVHGKPLFWWAKNNKLAEIEIPRREVEIFDLKLVSINKIPADKLKETIFKQIASVTGDFRQNEIKSTWEEFFSSLSCHPGMAENHDRISSKKDSIASLRSLQNDTSIVFQTAKFRISCSSGTYVRSLVNELGEYVGMGAITLEILRTKVGTYTLTDSLHLL